MSVKLDTEHSSISDLAKRRDDRRKVDFAFAKHQVLMHSVAHVLNVHVRESIAPSENSFGNRKLSLTVQVANIQG
jgi:hypothetical protein